MFINRMTRADMVKFMRFMGFNTEAPARVFKVKNVELEYEPNQTLLAVACQISKRPYIFLFSDHGLVNIYKNANSNQAIVDINSEYGLFEQAPACINITKQFLGYMTSRFQHEYLKTEIDRRNHILKSLLYNQKRTIKEKDESNQFFGTLAGILDPMHTDEKNFKEYFDIDLMYMKNQHKIIAQDNFIEELTNQMSYHANILEYLESDLKIILMETCLKAKEAYGNSSLLRALSDKKDIPPESFGA